MTGERLEMSERVEEEVMLKVSQVTRGASAL